MPVKTNEDVYASEMNKQIELQSRNHTNTRRPQTAAAQGSSENHNRVHSALTEQLKKRFAPEK